MNMFQTSATRKVVPVAFAGLFALAVLLLNSDIASAAQCRTGNNGFVPLECFDQSPKLEQVYTQSDDLGKFMNSIFVGAISLGAILAVLRLAWAGFRYMASDLPGVKGNSKEIIGDTLLGLLLLLSIWLILNQINPQLLNLKVNLSSAPPPPTIQFATGNEYEGAVFPAPPPAQPPPPLPTPPSILNPPISSEQIPTSATCTALTVETPFTRCGVTAINAAANDGRIAGNPICGNVSVGNNIEVICGWNFTAKQCETTFVNGSPLANCGLLRR